MSTEILPRRTARGQVADRLFRLAVTALAGSVLVVLILFFIELAYNSRLAMGRFGVRFVFTSTWNPVAGSFGALSSIYGTVVSTVIAMVLAAPASFLVALFLVEIAPPAIARPMSYAVELLAAIPSIIYGMWGLFVFAPLMADHIQPLLGRWAGFLPLFQGPPMGIGLLSAGFILALMILPFMTAVIREVLTMTPRSLREAAYGLGSTVWEANTRIILRHGLPAVVGGLFLGLGRALGETMAVTFVIGNSHRVTASLFEPLNTIASTLANEFAEAADPLYLSVLTELGLILLLMTFCIQLAARALIRRYQHQGDEIG